MADEEPKNAPSSDGLNGEDETPQIVVPSHAPLPLPPEVHYSRPSLPSGFSSRSAPPGEGPAGGGTPDHPAEIAGHGAGMAAGITFVVSIIAGAVAGNWIDGRWNHTGMPWATLIMTLLGATSGFINMQRLLSRSDRNRKKP